jgi:hypothetical protein
MPPILAGRTGTSPTNNMRGRWLRIGVKLIFATLLSFVPIIFALALDISMSLAGFPDGHVTDYEKAMVLPDHILIAASFIVACYIFFLSLRARNRRDIGTAGISLVCYIVLFLAIRYGVAAYFIDFRHLDFGQGG